MAFYSSSSRLISSSSHLHLIRRSYFSNVLSKLSPPSNPEPLSSPITTTTTTTTRSSYPFVNSTGRPPLMVSSILDETTRDCPCENGSTTTTTTCNCDDRHHLVTMATNGFKYENEDQIYDDYVKALAVVVGSEEEAKNKIYLVSCGDAYGFGVELDKRYVLKLSFSYGVLSVSRDRNYAQRIQNPYAQFTPMNWYQRLENIFSYHYLSREQKNKAWDNDHWLIAIKQPATGFDDYREIRAFIVQLLTKVLGSEEEAVRRIYIVWHRLPYGFGAEINKEASEKLREMKNDVLAVLPDYAFDVKDDVYVHRVLHIYPYAFGSMKIHPWIHGSRYKYCRQIDTGLEEESHESIDVSAKSDLAETSDCKHWFITMKKPVQDASLQQQVDTSIETIAKACGSGKEEAKEKIYRFQSGDDGTFSFGAAVDAEASKLIEGEGEAVKVSPDDLVNQIPPDYMLFHKGFKELKYDLRSWAMPQ